MRTLWPVLVLTCACLAVPDSARAQAPARDEVQVHEGTRLELGVHAAHLAPRGGLGSVFMTDDDTPYLAGDLTGGRSFGAEVRLGLPPHALAIRALVDYTPAAEASFRVLACDPGVFCLGDDALDARVLTAVADIVWRPPLPIAPVRPFLAIGAGARRYEIDGADYQWRDALIEPFAGARIRPVGHAAAGAEVRWGRIVVGGELGTFAGSFGALDSSSEREAGDLAADVSAAVGVRLRVR